MHGHWAVYVGIVSLALLCLGAAPKKPVQRNLFDAPADCKGEEQVLDVTADRMDSDVQTQTFVFESNVRVIRCDMTMTCDHLEMLTNAEGDQIERIIATGHVRMRQGERWVTAERAEYFDAEQKVVLTGNPRAWDPVQKHELTGDEMQIFLETERVVVKRARARFHPSQRSSSSPKSPGG